MAQKQVTILGSTGSIGVNTLSIIENALDIFSVVGLSGFSNQELLVEQIKKFRPRYVSVKDEIAANYIREIFGSDLEVYWGAEGLVELAKQGEIIVSAIVWFAGLQPTITAIKGGKRVALANKESLVVAGDLIKSLIQFPGQVIPVDSEHNSIYQALSGYAESGTTKISCADSMTLSTDNSLDPSKYVSKIALTASGGPFFQRTRDELKNISPAEAIKHPRWKMGAKISVDSATLMNKGLELIEAKNIFGVDLDKIEILIHPESIVHGFVEFIDGATLAVMYHPDMKVPIAHALSTILPERRRFYHRTTKSLNLFEVGKLNFIKPDFKRFPALRLCYDAALTGKSAPIVLNAANEVAVDLFLNGKIEFTRIEEIVEDALTHFDHVHVNAISDIKLIDQNVRDDLLAGFN